MTDQRKPMPIYPDRAAHVAACPACEVPTLVSNLAQHTAAMHCPACGARLRPVDINTYDLREADDE